MSDELVFPNLDSMGDGPKGLTKREYAAIMAMQGLVASGENDRDTEVGISNAAIDLADALLSALKKTKP